MRFVRNLDATRIAVFTLAAGLVGLGLDAGIAHFAGREMKNVLQLVPLIAGGVGFVALAAIAARKWAAERSFRIALRSAGAIIAAVGIAGTVMHGRVFMQLLEGTSLTWQNIELALAVAPPLAAPGAFIAIGGLLALLASPRVSLKIVPREPALASA